MKGIAFPPLLTGLAVAGDPLDAAVQAAAEADPGTVFYAVEPEVMRAAVLLAPESKLADALSVSFAVSLGMNDAIGALGPPEVALHLEWPGAFRVNGALCGGMRARAFPSDSEAEPDWLVIGIDMLLMDAAAHAPGERPDMTTLHAEGCGEVASADLIEAWARHMMNWLHIYLTEGFQPLHAAWRARAYRLGETVETPEAGTFLGLDEQGGMILQGEGGTRILPLTALLEVS